jgi:hypothetical protein
MRDNDRERVIIIYKTKNSQTCIIIIQEISGIMYSIVSNIIW